LAKNAKENEGNSTFRFRQGRTRAGQNLYNPALTQGTQMTVCTLQSWHSENSPVNPYRRPATGGLRSTFADRSEMTILVFVDQS